MKGDHYPIFGSLSVCSSEHFRISWVTDSACYTVVSNGKYHIHPRYPQGDKVSLHCLANALFSARLLSPSSLAQPIPTIIYPLDTPFNTPDSPGMYEFQVPERLELLNETSLELEVRLEFGNLPGARAGMLCGEGSLTCEAKGIAESIGEEQGIIGTKIEVSSGKTVRASKGVLLSFLRIEAGIDILKWQS